MTDKESAHIEADAVLLEFVPPQIKEAYLKIERWYS
jgi:hypothetical protein